MQQKLNSIVAGTHSTTLSMSASNFKAGWLEKIKAPLSVKIFLRVMLGSGSKAYFTISPPKNDSPPFLFLASTLIDLA